MKSFLFFYTKSICYNSMYAFVNSMVRTLRRMGHKCDTCTALRPQDLELYFGEKYDAIVDIDSTLPNLIMEDGSYYLDHIDAPFFNYLLDHPLYYHKPLSSGMKRQNVICIDEKHVDYVKENYENIQSVCFLPLGMMDYDEKLITPIKSRKIDLLFTGTYTSENEFYKRISKYNGEVQAEIMAILGIMLENENITPEEAIKIYIKDKGYRDPGKEMASICNQFYLADTGAAAATRAKVVRTLLKHGIPVTVCGHGWNKLHCKGEEYLTILPEKVYLEAVELAYSTKILLNIMPGFKAGMHDRIPTAMGHGAASCTDGTEYLNKVLGRDEYLKYDMRNLYELPDIISDSLSNQSKLQELADNGRRKAIQKFTWENRMEEWMEALG